MKKQLKCTLAVMMVLCMTLTAVPVSALRSIPFGELGIVKGADTNAPSTEADLKSNEDEDEFAGGDGTSSNPYLVSTPQQLNNVRYHLSSYFRQICDIDMSSINWRPIGYKDTDISSVGISERPASPFDYFTGSYDGGNYKIYNLTINDSSVSITSESYGLFAALDGGNVVYVHLYWLNYYVNKETTDYEANGGTNPINIGGIAGICSSSSVVSDCTCSGSIKLVNCSDANVGGLIGYGQASRCASNTNIYVFANASSRYPKDSNVCCGGIVGRTPAVNTVITECFNKGDITATAGNFLYAGGISGEYGAIDNCMNCGNITGNAIGLNLYNSSFAGNCNCGGIVGATSADYTKRCVNYGNISASLDKYGSYISGYAGGITGYCGFFSDGYIISCVNLGSSITSTKKDSNNQTVNANAGRIAGYSNSTSDSYSLNSTLVNGTAVTGNSNNLNGESVASLVLLTQTPYVDFDFDYLWHIDESYGGAVLSAVNDCLGYHSWSVDFENVEFVCSVCGKRQSISPVLGYEYGKDNFSFRNADVGSYYISNVGYRYLLPALKVDLLSVFSRKMLPIITAFGNNGNPYGGSCLGISAMNASFFAGMSTIDFGAANPYELSIQNAGSILPNKDTKLKDAINIMFYCQGFLHYLVFQHIQDGLLSGNNYESLVNISKNLKAGEYLPIVNFKYIKNGNTKIHAVNIIGIEPDDFMQNKYCITTYDSNNPSFPSCFLVSKDFSYAEFVDFSESSNGFEVKSVDSFITSPSFNIDIAAPGLRISPLYFSKSTNGIKKYSSPEIDAKALIDSMSFADNEMEEIISFIIPQERSVRITTPSGHEAYIDETGVLTSEIASAKAIQFADLPLTRILLPYEAGKYSTSCEESVFVNINYNHNSATLYADAGCDIVYSADGGLSYTPKTENEHIEAAYYRYGILDNSDVMGVEVAGDVSNEITLVCNNGNVDLFGEDVSGQTLSVQHNDDELTNEELSFELNEGTEGIIISSRDDSITITPCDRYVSGICGTDGDNLTWTLDRATGVLTISGEGAMADYTSSTYYGYAPWRKDYKEEITAIVIEQGVTTIGNYAFYLCSAVVSAELPDSLTSISERAFSGCTSLYNIELSVGLTSIGDYTFYNCSSMVSLDIPEGVTSIGSHAFNRCSSVESIIIPNSVTSIGSYAFSSCSSVASIIIPNGVTSIGGSAFSGCSLLTEVFIPESVISIGDNPFAYCASMTGIAVADDNPNFTALDGVLFDKNLQDLISYPSGKQDAAYSVPNGVTEIGYCAFGGSMLLSSLVIPEGVTTIGASAFEDSASLVSISLPEGVEKINGWTFYRCYSLAAIQIPNSVTTIGYEAFGQCESLSSAVIGSGVTGIEQYAFSNCTSLSSVTFDNCPAIIRGWAFENCSSLVSVDLPDSITIIDSHAFEGCAALLSVNIGNGVTSIGSLAFLDCPLLNAINVDSDNQEYSSIDGVLFSKDQKTLINYPCGKTSIEYAVPNGVTSLDNDSFLKCIYLETVSIPDTVMIIGYAAFEECSSLSSIIIPTGVTTISSNAFRECTALTSITIPQSVTTIGDYAFYKCASLHSAVFLGSQPEVFERVVFTGCAPDFCIYYTEEHASEWAPDGETTWNGYPIQMIADPQPQITVGDADGNGVLSFSDVAALYNMILSGGGLTSEQAYVCDVNGDGAVSFADIAALYSTLLGSAA